MIELLFYLFLNALRIYIMQRFVRLFFYKETYRKCMPYCYLAYYVINCTAYLFLGVDRLNLAVNILGLLSAVLVSYEGNWKRKLLSVLASVGMSLLTENIAWVIFLKGKDRQMLEYALFFSVFALFLLEVIIEKTIKFRKGIELSFYKDLFLILVFMGNMFVANVLIEGAYRNRLLLILALGVLLMVSITVFYLYEKLLDDYARRKEDEMYRMQLAMTQNQLEIMRGSNDVYRNMRHDMKHHTRMLFGYIEKGEGKKAIEYLEKMNDYIVAGRQYVDTGNECIDCILNYIIDEVNKMGGNIKTDIKIGENLLIEDFDINIILSNLLLNACEAIKKSKKKEIMAALKYDRGALKIRIHNTYTGTIIRNGDNFQSTKENKDGHGMGLANVRQMVAQYGGEMKIDYSEEEFYVGILLYI